jgi:hypothetical protein
LKVAVLAAIGFAFLDQRIRAIQWLAVGVCASAAFLLNEIGGRMPWRVLAWLTFTLVGYALSDLSIQRLVHALAATGSRGPLLGAALTYLLCGAVGAGLLAPLGWPSRGVWVYVIPYALTWFAGMCCFFGAIDRLGVVLAVIVQSTRGVISIGMGAGLARCGMTDLEEHAPRRVVLKRAVAAALMVAAIGLYSTRGAGRGTPPDQANTRMKTMTKIATDSMMPSAMR